MTPKDILQLESSDMRQAYLFEENGRWYAYEHSANRIEKICERLCRLQTQSARCLRSDKSRNRPQYFGKVFHHAVKIRCLYLIALQHKKL